MMRPRFGVILLLLGLVACQAPNGERKSSVERSPTGDFASHGIVEIGVLAPKAPPALSGDIAAHVREVVGNALIREKRYSVVRPAQIDGNGPPNPDINPASARSAADTDAVLAIEITEFDRSEQTLGRVWLSGSLRLIGKEGQAVWYSRFTNRKQILPGASDPVTTDERLKAVFRDLVLDELEHLPIKAPVANSGG